MAEHVRCLNLAVKLMDYLRSGDRVCDMLDAAEETQRLHHELFVALYAELAKIKIHLQRHVFGSIRRLLANLSCWRGERGLRRQKKLAPRAYNKWHETLVHDSLQHFLVALQSPDNFNEIKLTGRKRPFPVAAAQQALGVPVVAATMSSAASNGLGAMKTKDIVMWRNGENGELVNVATVGFFVEAKTHDGRAVKAVVHMHKKAASQFGKPRIHGKLSSMWHLCGQCLT